jgi:CubicO group peptidase (beta-lactamase class C family)
MKRRAGLRARLGFGLALGLTLTALVSPSHADVPEDVRWLDDFFADQLARHEIPGAAVAWVEQGETRVVRGYGLADVAAQRKVDGQTLFRIGSVTKLFVWTALWQLAERGKLHFEDDIEKHTCGLVIPKEYRDPITVQHLMDHTAGWESRRRGTYARGAAELLPLASLVETEMLPRVRAPGRVESYSNFGTCVAARVVECASGTSFERYLAEHTFSPLGLLETTLQQPLAPDSLFARGYVARDGAFAEQPFELIRMAPAGAMSASARDMAKFMAALLGSAPGWLTPETLETMRRGSHVPGPYLGGLAHGFFVANRNGLRVLWHGGDTILFHSLLMLVPERRLGVFVTYNAPGGAAAYRELMNAVLDRLGPKPAPSMSNWKPPPAVAGAYRSSRVATATYEKLEALSGDLDVRFSGPGITAAGRTWTPIAPWTFQEENGHDRIVFEVNDQGRVERVRMASRPMQTFERVSMLQAASTHRTAAWVGALSLLTPVAWASRRLRRTANASRWPLPLTVVSSVLGVALIGLALRVADEGTDAWLHGVPTKVWYAKACFAVLAMVTPACAVGSWLAWRGQWWTRTLRLHHSVVVVACALAVAWAAHWGLGLW